MNISALSNIELDAATLAADAATGTRVLQAVHEFIGRFVAYPSEHARVAHALWIAHAHLMDAWDTTPRLAFLSAEPASGKSRALEITELLVPRPVCAVNVSPAYLFRKVADENGAPTILFDEIDTVFGPKAKENEEIRGLLNAGHRRGQVAGRCVVRGNTVMTEEIPAYAAVAVAGLGALPDTILTRSVVVRMRRRHQGERVEPFRRRLHMPQGHAVRSRLEMWTASLSRPLPWPEMPGIVQDRDADVWEALLAVADAAGGDWPALARAAAVAFVSDKEAEPSLGVRLLADLLSVFGDTASRKSSKEIIADLLGLAESPWGDLRGKPLDERGLSKRLREYGIKPTTIRQGDSTLRGYEREAFHDAWKRYCPVTPPAESKTSLTGETVADVVELQPRRPPYVRCGAGDG